MNVIYIDVLITVNLFIDYLLLFSVKRLLHIHTKGFRILLGALFSSLTTPIIFLGFYTELTSTLIKPLISSATILIAYGYGNFKRFIIRSGMFWGLSMGLCGALLILEYLIDPKNLIIYRDTVYLNISPVHLIIFTLSAYIALTVYDKLKGQHTLRCKILKVTLLNADNTRVSFDCAIDTGLNLKEPFSGLPVIMAEKKLLKDIKVSAEKLRIIPFSTAAGDGIVYGFKPHKIMINGQPSKSDCYVAVTENKLQGEIKSIMGEELAENQ